MVVLGRLADPYGVRGWVRLNPYADDPLDWANLPIWWLGREGESVWREVKPRGLRAHAGGLVCLLDGFTDRNDADTLKGMLIAAPREALPATAEDEYYWSDLIGLEVVNNAGEILGRVDNLIETGANAVLRVVDSEGLERLLPFVNAVVQTVDKENGRIQVEWGLDW